MSALCADENLRIALGVYALGSLPRDEWLAVSRHLVGCAACRTEFSQFVQVVHTLLLVDLDLLDTEPQAGAVRRGSTQWGILGRESTRTAGSSVYRV